MRNDLLIVEYGEPGEKVDMTSYQAGQVPDLMNKVISQFTPSIIGWPDRDQERRYELHFHLRKAEEGSLTAFFEAVIKDPRFAIVKDLSATVADAG